MPPMERCIPENLKSITILVSAMSAGEADMRRMVIQIGYVPGLFQRHQQCTWPLLV